MPDPADFDDKEIFMADCIPMAVDEGHAQDEAAAMCSAMWDERSDTPSQFLRVLRVSAPIQAGVSWVIEGIGGLWHGYIWLVSVEETYVLVALGGLITRREHNEFLQRLLPMIEARGSRQQDKIRVVFEGGFCEQPPLDLLRAISQTCYVVDDDLLIGLRWILEDVALGADPLMSLANAYLENSSYSPVQHDLRKPKEDMLLLRIREAKAEAAIIAAAKMCEPGLDEQVTYSKTLDEAGIPYFLSEFEEKMTSFDQMQTQLETFAENILFF